MYFIVITLGYVWNLYKILRWSNKENILNLEFNLMNKFGFSE